MLFNKNAEISGTVIGPSQTHGLGLFATREFVPGEIVGAAVDCVPSGGDLREDLLQTGEGRYVNHSDHPNTEVVPISSAQYGLKALRLIQTDEEVTVSYEQGMECFPGANIVVPDSLEETKQAAYYAGVDAALYRVNLQRR